MRNVLSKCHVQDACNGNSYRIALTENEESEQKRKVSISLAIRRPRCEI